MKSSSKKTGSTHDGIGATLESLFTELTTAELSPIEWSLAKNQRLATVTLATPETTFRFLNVLTAGEDFDTDFSMRISQTAQDCPSWHNWQYSVKPVDRSLAAFVDAGPDEDKYFEPDFPFQVAITFPVLDLDQIVDTIHFYNEFVKPAIEKKKGKNRVAAKRKRLSLRGDDQKPNGLRPSKKRPVPS